MNTNVMFALPISVLAEETLARTIYVATTGNDTTGNGSITTPYATFAKALSDIKPVLNGIQIKIKLGAGTFDIATYVSKLYTDFIYLSGASILIEGTPELAESEFTATNNGQTNKFLYTSGTLTVTENEYRDAFATADDVSYFPMGPCSGSNFYVAQHDTWTFSKIYTIATTVTAGTDFNRLYANSGDGFVYFKFLKIQNTDHFIPGHSGGIFTYFTECIIDLLTNNKKVYYQNNIKEDIFRRNIVLITGNTAYFIDYSVGTSWVYNVYIRNKLANNTSIGIRVQKTRIGHMIVDNFRCGIRIEPNFGLDLYNAFMAINCGALIQHEYPNTSVLNKSYPLYIESCKYVICNYTATLKNSYIDPYVIGTPTSAYFVPVSGATWGTASLPAAGQVNNKFIDNENNNAVKLTGYYPEVDYQKKLTIGLNASGTLAVGDITQNYKVTLKCYVTKTGPLYRSFDLVIYATGATVAINEANGNGDNITIVFTASVINNVITLAYVNTGAAATMFYTVERIMLQS